MAAARVGVLVVLVGGTRSVCRRPAAVVLLLLLLPLLLRLPGAVRILMVVRVPGVWCSRRLLRAGIGCGGWG